MTYPTITTTEALRSFMAEVSGEPVSDNQLFWFVCMYNAKLISESFTLSDIAAMLQGGIKPIDSLQDVQGFIDTFYDDDNDVDYNKYQNLHIVRHALEQLGERDKAADISVLIDTFYD